MRRPRDWGHPCPNAECPLFKRMNRGNVSAISTYMTESRKRRIFRCRHCETTFSETQDTVFFDLRTSEEKVMMALKMLLVRVDLVRAWRARGDGPGVARESRGQSPRRSTRICCGTCPSPRSNSTRCGTSSRASMLMRRTSQAKPCPQAKTGGNGSGSALLLSFA